MFAFAFRRTTPTIDGLQILAASAIPSLAYFLGLRMPEETGAIVLAYIGLAGLAWLFLRLMVAPYFLWREQVADAASLRLELNKPEQLELARRAELMAEDRREAMLLLSEVFSYWLTYHYDGKKGAGDLIRRSDKKQARLHQLMLAHRLHWDTHGAYTRLLGTIRLIEARTSTEADISALTEAFLRVALVVGGKPAPLYSHLLRSDGFKALN